MTSLDVAIDNEHQMDALHKALEVANGKIAETVLADQALQGMGTTLTAVIFSGDRAALAHVGDSRAYLLRDGRLNQLTKDDTYVQMLVDQGLIRPEEASTHPRRAVVTQALQGEPVSPAYVIVEPVAGDRWLLCSDGLTTVVQPEGIEAELLAQSDPQAAADGLVPARAGRRRPGQRHRDRRRSAGGRLTRGLAVRFRASRGRAGPRHGCGQVISTVRLKVWLPVSLTVVGLVTAIGEFLLPTGAAQRLLGDLAQTVAGATTVVACLHGARSRTGVPRTWRLLVGVGAITWTLARLLWDGPGSGGAAAGPGCVRRRHRIPRPAALHPGRVARRGVAAAPPRADLDGPRPGRAGSGQRADHRLGAGADLVRGAADGIPHRRAEPVGDRRRDRLPDRRHRARHDGRAAAHHPAGGQVDPVGAAVVRAGDVRVRLVGLAAADQPDGPRARPGRVGGLSARPGAAHRGGDQPAGRGGRRARHPRRR